MTRYILENNALSAFINHLPEVDARARAVRRRGHRIGTCVPVVGELAWNSAGASRRI